jgi:predicted flavoprotein YhiN
MKVIVIGGGPAGIIAAISSALNGDEVTILEKNSYLRKEIINYRKR